MKSTFLALVLVLFFNGVISTESTLTTCEFETTTSGNCCSIPFTYKGVTYNNCTKADYHRLWCSLDTVYKGRWGNCLISTESTLTTCEFETTTSGNCCSIPFTYKGVTYNNCTKADYHRLWCSLDTVYKERWGNCLVPCPVNTTSGKCCSFPFEYEGVTYKDCTKAKHHRPWCSLDAVYKGRWGDCQVPCPIITTSDKCCRFPFEYKGVTYKDCTKANHHRPWCSLDAVYKGKWGDCQVPCSVKTTSGSCCKFPFKYNGVTYKDCTKAEHHRAWCSLDAVYNGRWGNCQVPCPVKTTSGKCCSFPFNYEGVTYKDCTKANHHRVWCSLDPTYKGKWGNCQVPCPIKTTSGKCCSFPFKYKGVLYNDCTKADNQKPWCSLDPVYEGRWGNCNI